ncbi:MAG: hypothetical protein N2484_06125 [Clostridia bacterium]|nr:hypothetical protein [Clostridia bacterium]
MDFTAIYKKGKKNLLSTKFEKFLAKRVLIISIIVAILDIVFFYHRFIILAGLATGTVFSLLRLNSYMTTFSRLLSQASQAGEKKAVSKSITRFLINSALVILVLGASLNFSQDFFIGTLEGIFMVPLAIMINGITEALGITHNNFE